MVNIEEKCEILRHLAACVSRKTLQEARRQFITEFFASAQLQ